MRRRRRRATRIRSNPAPFLVGVMLTILLLLLLPSMAEAVSDEVAQASPTQQATVLTQPATAGSTLNPDGA